MKPLSLALLALLVAGCAKEPPVYVVDTFCMTAKKRTWDPDVDSTATMREAVVFNRYIDRRCGIPSRKA